MFVLFFCLSIFRFARLGRISVGDQARLTQLFVLNDRDYNHFKALVTMVTSMLLSLQGA